MSVNHTDHAIRGVPRAALYLRSASTPQSDPDSSLATQRRALLAAIDQCGLELVGEYSDAGVAGLPLERLGLARLLQDASTNPRPFDIVLVEDFSRLSRDATQVIQVTTQLARVGIRLVSADEVKSAALLSAGNLAADRM